MTANFDVFDYLILILVLLISIIIGLYQTFSLSCRDIFNRKIKNRNENKKNGPITVESSKIKNYLIAGGNMKAIPIAFSLLATNFSGNVLLGFPAEIYEYGCVFWLSIFGLAFTPLIGAFLTGPFFLRLKVMSVFEYLKIRYNSNLIRQIGVFCYFMRIILSTAMYIYGPSTTINSLSSIEGPWSIILIGGVATLYTTVGGIR